MDKRERNNIVRLEGKEPTRKKGQRRFKLKFLNVVMLFAVVYFVFTMASQEFKMRQIKSQTEAANAEYAQLLQEEALINKKINEASGSDMVENKAKSILGWVGKDEYKVVEKKQQ